MADEQLQLLRLPDNDEEDEANRRARKPPKKKAILRVRNPRYAAKGAANVMKDWPTHHANAHCWLIPATILLLILFISLYVTCFRKNPFDALDEKKRCVMNDLKTVKEIFKHIFGGNKKTPDEVCKEELDKDRASIQSENSTLDSQQSFSLLADCHVFYIHDESIPLSHLKACAIESALRYAPDKQFFLLKLTNASSESSGNQTENDSFHILTTVLKNQYSNLKVIKTEGCKYFTETPLRGLWKNNSELTYFAAQIVTAWRFGGLTLSLNSLVTNRQLFDQFDSSVQVSKLALRSRLQCNKYMHELVLETRNLMGPSKNSSSNSSTDSINDVIDKSLKKYCHNSTGCHGVKIMDNRLICDRLEEQCYLLNFKNWRKETSNWKSLMYAFCPIINRRSLNFTIDEND